MKCQEFQDNLRAFFSEQLDDTLRLQCETHITSCVECLDLWLNNFSNQYQLETESGEELITQSCNRQILNPVLRPKIYWLIMSTKL